MHAHFCSPKGKPEGDKGNTRETRGRHWVTKGRQKGGTSDTNGDKREVGWRQQGDTEDKRETKG